jgi:hypothetical protein
MDDLWNGVFGTGSPAEEATRPRSMWDNLFSGAVNSLATLPKRAVDASTADMANLGDHSQPLQSVAPSVEAAMTMTGGAGAFPAEANTLRAGIRPYQNVPESLMGFRKNGPQKGFYETNYPHEQPVKIYFKDGDSFVDSIKGMNANHALERAYRSWPDAMHIEALGVK